MAIFRSRNTQHLILTVVAIIVATVLSLKYVLPYITPFIIAALLAILIDPAVDLLEKRLRAPRGLAVLVVLMLVLVGVTLFLVVGTARLVIELEQLLRSLPEFQNSIGILVEEWSAKFSTFYAGLPDAATRAIRSSENNFYQLAAGLVSAGLNAVKQLPNAFTVLVISILATYFMSRDRDRVMKGIVQLVPREWRPKVRSLETDVGRAIMGYIRAQLTLISITTVLSIFGLLIVGVNYAWLLGLLAGALDLMPMIGPSGVYLPLALYLLFNGDIGTAIAVGVVWAVVLLVRQVTEPRIVGRNVGLHPLTTLLAIYVGFQLFGINGFIIGPLTAIVLKAVFAVTVLPLLDAPTSDEPKR